MNKHGTYLSCYGINDDYGWFWPKSVYYNWLAPWASDIALLQITHII